MLAALLLVAQTISAIDVRISGMEHTRPEAVRRLMAARAGALYDERQLDQDLARLRTLGILYDVERETSDDAGKKRVEVRAKDRWSLVPVLGVRRGGGRTSARVGVTDHNVLGELFTIYAELTSNAQIPFLHRSSADRVGNYLYVDVPRLFGTRLSPKISWLRDFSDFATFQIGGGTSYVYDRSRLDYRLELRFEIVPLVTLLGGADFRRDAYGTSDVSPSEGVSPARAETASAIAGFTLGQIEEGVSLLRGAELSLATELGGRAVSATGQLRLFAIPWTAHNLCVQLTAQATTGRGDSFLFRAGGQREIRGFLDAYFQGQRLLRANLEWRYDFLRTHILVPVIGQLAAFTDVGWVSGRADAVAGLPYEGTIASAGVGVRGIPIPFARAVGRIDVATGLWPIRRFDVSFSGQQFVCAAAGRRPVRSTPGGPARSGALRRRPGRGRR